MGRAALPWAVVALLLVLTPAVHGDLGLFSSSSSSGAGGSSKPAASTEEKGSKDGEHHPQIIVTGAEVGVDEPPEPGRLHLCLPLFDNFLCFQCQLPIWHNMSTLTC